MKNLASEFVRYKHYLLLIVALVIANYVVLPLSEWQQEQQRSYALLEKRSVKTENLIRNKQSFNIESEKLSNDVANISKFIYTDKDEAKFKLNAQSKLEKILNDADCQIDRIGFKGSTVVDEKLSNWRVEVRYTGDAVCLTKTFRLIESANPIFNIVTYNANHREFKAEANGNFVVVLNLNAWHLKGGRKI